MAQKLVILDRDGVINHDSINYVKRVEEWIPYPSSIQAIARLTKAGYRVAIATNQSGIARQYYNTDTLNQIHQRMSDIVTEAGGHLDHIAYCPHVDANECDCRKPRPGLLYQIQSALELPDLEGSWMVGDSLRDIQAGSRAGCQPVLVRTGNGNDTLRDCPDITRLVPGTLVFDDLASFVEQLLSASSKNTHTA
ncbi:D-glycero-beta-D-manno-heptose 1,7-bisphosphate 7-phosphatase [Halomonas halocynthiae]|uniref:D-glycero-beta-D-manno-heptose 1,7-bisphosphate 7-phosphatase n=1 Tax=Halomonas halocynthiae TaxID=176290 RepID=UPI0004015D70|nr:D-glycero-beta-D-manno-heptose 1,7-bisphosphate 7-phosphatase [Halomonas halocynthiae]